MFLPTRIIAITAVFALGGTTYAQAQITVGPRVGLNLADISFDFEDVDDSDLDTKLMPAPQVGLTLNVAFGNLAVQPSLLFSQKGAKVTVDESSPGFSNVTETTARLNYLELPVNLVYTTGGTEGFQVFAGPYIGLGLGGKIRQKYTVSQGGTTLSDSESYKAKFARKSKSTSDVEYFNQPDFGVNGGVGYKTGPFQVQAGYSLGLNNMVPRNPNGDKPTDKSHNRVIQFSMSYFFGS